MSGLAARVMVPASADVRPDARQTLEPVLLRVEQHLHELQHALATSDMPCLELHAGELQRALAVAVEHFMQAARRGGVPTDLRQRLSRAGAQVAAQRDALARATAAMDRALDVLMPGFGTGPVLYSAQGTTDTRTSSGSLQA